jgi:SAM-dependent methyltransferase
MFGATLDYLILRPLTHKRNLATETELDERQRHREFDIGAAQAGLRGFMDRLEFQLPMDPELRYLDVGCGAGGVAIALAKAGCENITGIDILPRQIAEAEFNARRHGVSDRVSFICQDTHEWSPPHLYDIIISHEALEHVDDVEKLLAKLRNWVSPNGVFLIGFGPLFYSPFGDHMGGFFRLQIPWRGTFFAERALLRLRRECFRPTDPATRYREIQGGLNLLRYGDFLKYVENTGWQFRHLSVNPQFKRVPLAYALSNLLLRIPMVRDFIAASVYAILQPRT